MAMEYKNVRTTDISRREGLLSALDDLAPLPAPYDKNGLEPALSLKSGMGRDELLLARRLLRHRHAKRPYISRKRSDELR